MNREIKFRVHIGQDGKLMHYKYLPVEKLVKEIQDTLEVGGEILGYDEWTSLKDKNGKDIFEGDIVGYWDNACWEVLYVAEKGAFRFGNRISHFPIGELKRKEVIGNIYEDTDLLSEEK